MENEFVSYGDIQIYIENYYLKYKKKTTVAKALEALNATIVKSASFYIDNESDFSKSWSYLLDEDFIIEIYKLPFACKTSDKFTLNDIAPKELPEKTFFGNSNDVLIFRQFHNIDDPMHSHNFFEMFYVYKGNCQLKFENELRPLSEGDLCIIAPDSCHSLIHDDNSATIITISIRKSTFESSFFQQLTHKDLLSSFFRNILFSKTFSNYILFSTDNSNDIKLIIRNLMLEFNKRDAYSNGCCISWVNLLFSFILRSYSDSIDYYNYDLTIEPSKVSTEFYSILKYIQYNYRTVTLKSLADIFHYSEAYMSILIKKHTGLSFIQLITKLKMSDACEYLKNTNMPIEKVSEVAGYNSSNHFSRAFKEYYSCSPIQYRQQWHNN